MKIKYTFVNGETSEVDVTDDLGAVLLDLDRLEYNNDQTETRRHASLDGMVYEGKFFAAEDTDIAALFADEPDPERITKAIAMLKPQQQALIRAVYFEGMSVSDYAAREGVSQPAISQRLATAIKNLKKLF